MRGLLIFATGALISASAAGAVTIQEGKTYLADFDYQNSELLTVFEIISIDGPIVPNGARISFGSGSTSGIGDNVLDPGETITLGYAEDASSPYTFVSAYTNSGPTSMSEFTFDISSFGANASGTLAVSAAGGSFDIDLVQLGGTVDVTHNPPSGLTQTTITTVFDIRDFRETVSPPDPNVVPLPASGLMLGSLLAGVIGWRRWRFN